MDGYGLDRKIEEKGQDKKETSEKNIWSERWREGER